MTQRNGDQYRAAWPSSSPLSCRRYPPPPRPRSSGKATPGTSPTAEWPAFRAGNPHNVSIDANGYLHLRIMNFAGRWTASELFTVDNIGFGTYQWVVQGDIWNMDPVTVLGLFPYGPANGIGVTDRTRSTWNFLSGITPAAAMRTSRCTPLRSGSTGPPSIGISPSATEKPDDRAYGLEFQQRCLYSDERKSADWYYRQCSSNCYLHIIEYYEYSPAAATCRNESLGLHSDPATNQQLSSRVSSTSRSFMEPRFRAALRSEATRAVRVGQSSPCPRCRLSDCTSAKLQEWWISATPGSLPCARFSPES